ncbi:MAG: mannose-1-phosphate guanylyltransferase [Spirochaetales bacterium]|nr:mannose-1-phosphate guanylyltransferase [Spirochaetales bacterium]
MRYALIIAGGSGTRLWPLSRRSLPKQLIRFINGKSLLEVAYDRLERMVPPGRRYICAGDAHKAAVLRQIPALSENRFLGEPTGRDTLSALAFSAAVIRKADEEAVIAVFTADHIIEPVDEFLRTVEEGYAVVESTGATLMTFGITPTHPATGYGYLELGDSFKGRSRIVNQFREKPDAQTAAKYLASGPERYLWNSGMFIWKAEVFLDCVRRYEPDVYDGIVRIAEAWDGPDASRVISDVYPRLKKISVDFAVMENASRDPAVTVAAVPMKASWLDVGSWPAYGEILKKDGAGNAVSGCKSSFLDSSGMVAVSDDPDHLIATIGCSDLVIVHSANATLICPKGEAEKIKALHAKLSEELGEEYL